MGIPVSRSTYCEELPRCCERPSLWIGPRKCSCEMPTLVLQLCSTHGNQLMSILPAKEKAEEMLQRGEKRHDNCAITGGHPCFLKLYYCLCLCGKIMCIFFIKHIIFENNIWKYSATIPRRNAHQHIYACNKYSRDCIIWTSQDQLHRASSK